MKRNIFIITIIFICILAIILINNKSKDIDKRQVYVEAVEEEKEIEQQETIEEIEEVYEEPQVEETPYVAPPSQNVQYSYTARLTSYYPEEGETTTATGLGINDFQVNDKGWFLYQGKLVVATASERLGYTNMVTYNLYDEIVLNIDGIDYSAIVLDVCGACQWDNRIDLFVSSVIYTKDTQITVKR